MNWRIVLELIRADGTASIYVVSGRRCRRISPLPARRNAGISARLAPGTAVPYVPPIAASAVRAAVCPLNHAPANVPANGT